MTASINDNIQVYQREFIVFREDNEQLMRTVMNTDWTMVIFLSTNSAYNLRTSLILEFRKVSMEIVYG